MLIGGSLGDLPGGLAMKSKTRLIPLLNSGRKAVIDASDYGLIRRKKWMLNADGYVVARARNCDGSWTFVLLHRFLMNPPAHLWVDHRNRDPLNCCRSNLRILSPSQSGANRGINKNNTSGYRGVTWHRHAKKWVARIRQYGYLIDLLYSDNPMECARAYDSAAVRLFGEYAATNESLGLLPPQSESGKVE